MGSILSYPSSSTPQLRRMSLRGQYMAPYKESGIGTEGVFCGDPGSFGFTVWVCWGPWFSGCLSPGKLKPLLNDDLGAHQ